MATEQLLTPFYQDVQAHYDLSNEFFRIFLGPTMLYTCAYYERPDMTLEEAGTAKNDLALGKLDLEPGMRLLDIGCGWGNTLIRAVEKFGVQGIGLTLSGEQVKWANEAAKHLGDRVEYRLQGWEEFDEPVDRIVAICSTEHFRQERYGHFFEKCYKILPAKAPMVVQVICFPEADVQLQKGLYFNEEDVALAKFIQKKIFPGGQLRRASMLSRYAKEQGFETTRVHSLNINYAYTLEEWARRLEANKEKAIAITSQEIYDMYMRYMTGCAERYRSGKLDLVQLSFKKMD